MLQILVTDSGPLAPWGPVRLQPERESQWVGRMGSHRVRLWEAAAARESLMGRNGSQRNENGIRGSCERTGEGVTGNVSG